MSLNSKIEDGTGSGAVAQVNSRNALVVQSYPPISGVGIPPEVLTSIRVQRENFTNSSGSKDINVDGSTTSAEFVVQAEEGVTKWITGFRIIMEGTNLEIETNDFRRFGNATIANTPLPNGLEIFVIQSGIQVDISVDPIGVIGDFLNYSDDFINLVNAVGTQEDYLQFQFAFDQPVVLPDGSEDRIVIQVNDDLTPIDTMFAIARGYKENS